MTRHSGQAYLPHIIAHIAERYRFVSAPRSVDELGGNKAEFRHGLFEDNAIETLDVYTDGLVVASRSDTDFIDKFIADVVAWLENDHGYSVVETHTVSKMYESTLLVESDADVFRPFGPYGEILRMTEKALQDASGLEIAYQNFGFTLSADQTRNPALKSAPFRFERKEGIDFSRHQFFAVAPLKTKQHLEVLERLEQLSC